MSLETFSLFVDKTTLIACNNTVFKLKLEYEELPPATKKLFRQAVSEKSVHCQIEDACRAFFYMLENRESLHPIQTDHFLIYPNVRQWPLYKTVQFFIDGKALNCHKDVILLKIVCKDVTGFKVPQKNYLSTCEHQGEVNVDVTNVSQTIPPTLNSSTKVDGQYNSNGAQHQQQCDHHTFLDKQPSVAVSSHFQGIENISLVLATPQTNPAPTLQTKSNSVGVLNVSHELRKKPIIGKDREQVDHNITVRRTSPILGKEVKKVAVEYPMRAELPLQDTFKQSDPTGVCPELIFKQSDHSQLCPEVTFNQHDPSHSCPEPTFDQGDTGYVNPELTFNQSDLNPVCPASNLYLEPATTPPGQVNTQKGDQKHVIPGQKQTLISVPRENRSHKIAQDLCSDVAKNDWSSCNQNEDIHQYHTRAVLSGEHVTMNETRQAAGCKLTTRTRGNVKKTYSSKVSSQKTVNKSFTKQPLELTGHNAVHRKVSKDHNSASLTSVELNKKLHDIDISCLTPIQRPNLINQDSSCNNTALRSLEPSSNKELLKYIRLKHLSIVSKDKHSSAGYSNHVVLDTKEYEGAESRLNYTRYNRSMKYKSDVVLGSDKNSGNSQQELREKNIATPSHNMLSVTRQGQHKISKQVKTRGKEENQRSFQKCKNYKTRTMLAPDDDTPDFSAGSKYDVAAGANRRITRSVSVSPSSKQTKHSSSSQEDSSSYSSPSNHKSKNLKTAEDSKKLKKAKRQLLSSKDGVWLF